MDLSSIDFKINNLLDDNYHTRKHLIQLVLSLKELEDYLEK